MRPDVTAIYLKEIADNTKKISDVLANKNVEQTVGEHRIGALRRISATIEYINKATIEYRNKNRSFVDGNALNILDKIKEILLGIEGGD